MKIAYVGPFAFPESHANSLRVRGMAEAIAQGGHEVVICPGMRSSEDKKNSLLSIHVDGVDEYSRRSGLSRLPGVRGLFIGDATIDWLRSRSKKPDAIILYGTHLSYLLRLQKYAAETGVKLFLDVVEWYDPRHLPGGLFGPYAAMNEWAMRHATKKVDGLFVISSYLDRYFSSAGCRTLRVPPLFSVAPIKESASFRDTNAALNVCYVGSPGKKEDFSVLFSGIKMARDHGLPIYFHMVGVSEFEFRKSYPNVALEEKSADWLRFYGRISNDAAKNVIASCDFTIIVRQKTRVAQAGFPSKVSESLSLGIPVISNSFSDVEKYIRPNNAGVMIEDLSANGVFTALSAAAKLNDAELIELKSNARALAKRDFSPSEYSREIGSFLSEFL